MMNEAPENYFHTVKIDEENRMLVITRVHEDGTQQLFTSVSLPSKSFLDDEQGFRNFAQILGENLLIDSPAARKLLGL